MSRTYRNRSSVPHKWTVRDNGGAYYNKTDLWGMEEKKRDKHLKIPRFRSRIVNKESKYNRKYWYKKYRAESKNLVKLNKFLQLYNPRKTCGWLTW